MPAEAVREIVSRELRSLGRSFDDVFASFDDVPLGSASVAQARPRTRCLLRMPQLR
jgi:predicted unusual protein kinase regulating ubiquinone biosynthesis (AarF/ABC1/UbiB family)